MAGFIVGTTTGTYGMIVQATVLLQTEFWPIQSMLDLSVNALTGLMLWEDYYGGGGLGRLRIRFSIALPACLLECRF